MNKNNPIKATGKENKVIYVYHHPESKEHEGWLKIGDQTGYNSGRIKDQNEADNIKAETLYMTDAFDKNGKSFRDFEVHAIIDATSQFEREKKKNSRSGRYSEWYRMNKNEAIAAIEARKNLTGFDPNILKKINLSVVPRKEQQDAINQTYDYWRNSLPGNREFLWNAKPRFGKTLTSYWFVDKIEAKKVLIVTNRPTISDSWYTDYRQFIQPRGIYKFGSTKDNKYVTFEGNLRGRALNVDETKFSIKNNNPTIFFISLQDIKGKDSTNHEMFKQKNQWIFNESWDLFIIDESHEATETINAQKLFKNLKTNFTLHLSGTPFKALANKKFKNQQIFNWTYEDEQSAKENWDPTDGENPYYELPRMNMFAYRLSNTLNATVGDGEYAFDLNELFKTTQGKFVYEEMVLKFLDNMFGINSKNNQNNRPFPFVDTKIRDELRHTFWLLPSVSAVKALKKLMQDKAKNSSIHKIFTDYEIIDASAKGDDEHEGKNALEKVRKTIGEGSESLATRTITLSCGQLTTGVTIKPWTAVLMLYGAEGGKTSATKYLQAAFRCQNPWRYTDENGNDMLKENCYVFDFAPDRLLLIFQDYAKSVIGGGEGAEAKVKKLLNFLTVVAEDEYGEMKELDANEVVTMPLKLMTQEIVDGKFITSNKLFNIGNIFHLPTSAREILNEMGTIKKGRLEHDKTKNPVSEPQLEYDDDGNLILNESNLGKKKYEAIVQDNSDLPTDHPPTIDDLPPSDAKTKLEKQVEKEQRVQEEEFHDHLRYFARAIPMILMAYGKPDTKLENFEKYIDSATFQELVGITKQQFQDLRDKYKLFNEEVFNASIIEFLNRKAELADYYENDSDLDIFDYIPPQQTNQIYTPKSIVKKIIDNLEKENPKILKSIDTTFFDPYLKSGLFITEIVKRLYKNLEFRIPDKNQRLEHILTHQIYGFAPNKILHLISSENIFGFMRGRPEFKKVWYQVEKHFVCFDNEDELVFKNLSALHDKVNKEWGKNMKFTAVIGNPPYQVNDNGARDDGKVNASASPIYNLFIEESKKISELQSLIMPARWTTGAGKGLNEFTKTMLSDRHIKNFILYNNSREVFPTVDIKGGVCYFLRDENYIGKATITVHTTNGSETYDDYLNSDNIGSFIPFQELVSILKKIKAKTINIEDNNMQTITSVLKPYGLRTDFFKNPKKYGLPEISKTKKTTDDIEIIGLDGTKRTSRYVSTDYPLPTGRDTVNKWKLFIPYAYGSGDLGELGGVPILGAPMKICTETFLRIGSFDSSYEAENLMKYYKTKFFRMAVGILKTTQHATTTFRYVPIQDFTQKSDIDWSQSVSDIDKQLYRKYDLSQDETDFIETHVKAME